MNREDIFNLIVRISCEVLPDLEGHTFQPDDRLADLGANSVDRAEIVTMTLDTLSLEIPRIELFKAKNIGELADVLYEKMQSA
ncbi:MAG: acyl carrier protein [Firmicutes bacterium]|nr:acyl carrier protein [Bacillota bacterium]